MFKHIVTKLLLVSMGFSSSLLLAKSKSNEKASEAKAVEQKAPDQKGNASSATPSASYSSLTITNNEKVGGDLVVNGSAVIGGALKAKNSTINATAKIGNDCTKGSLNVTDCSSINENLVIGKALTTKCIQAENASICKENCGSLFCDNNNTGSLQVVHNAQIGGATILNNVSSLKNSTINFSGDVGICNHKLLVNEINPVSSLGEEDDNGVTCFSGNVGIHPNQKLLVNEINPVMLDSNGKCVINDEGTTCFSGNVALDPSFTHTLFVNEINPVTMDENGNCFPNENGTTCFSGNVGINPNRVIYVNEIDPVMLDADCNCCTENTDPCACTNFSGALNVGSLISTNTTNLIANARPNNLYGELSQDINENPINLVFDAGVSSMFNYPATLPFPVLRIFLNTTDQNINTQAAKQAKFHPNGAWVKLDIFGMAQINGTITPPIVNAHHQPYSATFNFDVYTQLTYFIGANGNSQLIGTLNGELFNNTLSSALSVNYPDFYQVLMSMRGPKSLPFETGLLTYNYYQHKPNNLFGMVPTAANVLSPITLLGIPYSCVPLNATTDHSIVDIALIGLLQLPNADFNAGSSSINLIDGSTFTFDVNNALNINNVTVGYQVISPNLPMNMVDNLTTNIISIPPCIPDLVDGKCVFGRFFEFFEQFVEYGNISYNNVP